MLIITNSREINETIDSDILMKDTADVKIYGVINGDVHVFPGTSLSVFGQINGSIVATDAAVYVESEATVKCGFSVFAGQLPRRSPFSYMQTDNNHLTTAIKNTENSLIGLHKIVGKLHFLLKAPIAGFYPQCSVASEIRWI